MNTLEKVGLGFASIYGLAIATNAIRMTLFRKRLEKMLLEQLPAGQVPSPETMLEFSSIQSQMFDNSNPNEVEEWGQGQLELVQNIPTSERVVLKRLIDRVMAKYFFLWNPMYSIKPAPNFVALGEEAYRKLNEQ